MVKYIVIPGVIQSKSDGQFHHISAAELIGLYGVNPKECKILATKMEQATYRIHPGQILLVPRCDGNYNLKAQNQNE